MSNLKKQNEQIRNGLNELNKEINTPSMTDRLKCVSMGFVKALEYKDSMIMFILKHQMYFYMFDSILYKKLEEVEQNLHNDVDYGLFQNDLQVSFWDDEGGDCDTLVFSESDFHAYVGSKRVYLTQAPDSYYIWQKASEYLSENWTKEAHRFIVNNLELAEVI